MESHNPPFINEITISNLLSFGAKPVSIPLTGLNIIIGPNGSGKSNLIDVISLLQSAPSDLSIPIRSGGGTRDWLWLGDNKSPTACIDIVTTPPLNSSQNLRYSLSFSASGQSFELVDERIENSAPHRGNSDPYFYYRNQNNNPVLNVKGEQRMLRREDLKPDKSVLAQRKEPDLYPELTWLGSQFEGIRIYREWSFGRNAPLRVPQKADAPNDFLVSDCTNLGLVLNSFRKKPKVKRRIQELLSNFYEGIDDFEVIIEGGTVQVFLQEGEFSVPATRLSDGTLRYLCLLAILCHPSPPRLICIEEPELGIHADIIPCIAELLKEASSRSQIIVTTHSAELVDAISDSPESVIVCEKHNGCTSMKRLETEILRDWLMRYSLGQLWRKGEIGGNRW